MPNGNGNEVTVKLREKAEKILISKYDRLVKDIKHQQDELKDKAKKEVLAELGIDKLICKFKSLKKEMDKIEQEIRAKAGESTRYYYQSDIEAGNVYGENIEKAVEKKVSQELNLEAELDRLEKLRDKLLEELWLAGQSDEVKDILSRMV